VEPARGDLRAELLNRVALGEVDDETSTRTPYFVRNRSATACRRSSRLAVIARSKPSPANTSAKASPMPEEAL
jgi:hypothetical protein